MSPVISLLIPIIFLLFPFVLLKFIHKVPITFQSYKELLFKNMKHNIFGQFIYEFSHGGNYDKKMYVLMGLGFYFFTIYQNVLTCMKFYNNVMRVKKMLYQTKEHICHYINISDSFIEQIDHLDQFNEFKQDIRRHTLVLEDMRERLSLITSDSFSIKDVNNIGDLLSTLYILYDSTEYNDSICYSFGCLDYISYIQSIKQRVREKKISLCKFNKKRSKIKKQYYLPMIDESHVSNDIILDKNYIITGPNASGKTTLLKTTFINLILSQQIGAGCYKSASIQPYDEFFCYLNIPDTSDRDSLFQAEARRCLDIVTHIRSKKDDKDYRSICMFDELYSGTNPVEAVKSAKAYLQYLSTLNVTFLLTTHYYDLCELNKKRDLSIQNIFMDANIEEDGTITYKYVIKNGVSQVKGGCSVLQQLNYPNEILDKL